jgi:RimJ/RimL family protein N-acetyltransferase
MTVLCQTERLVLRCFAREDLDALHSVLSDPDAMRFSLKGPISKDEAAQWLEQRMRAASGNQPTQYAVLSKKAGSCVAGMRGA